jgi:hypothetical protein
MAEDKSITPKEQKKARSLLTLMKVAEDGAFLLPTERDGPLKVGRVIAARQAIAALGKAHHKSALPLLNRIAEEGKDPGCKVNAVTAIDQILNDPPGGFKLFGIPWGPNGPINPFGSGDD